jgi:hypothetical protein
MNMKFTTLLLAIVCTEAEWFGMGQCKDGLDCKKTGGTINCQPINPFKLELSFDKVGAPVSLALYGRLTVTLNGTWVVNSYRGRYGDDDKEAVNFVFQKNQATGGYKEKDGGDHFSNCTFTIDQV